MVSVLKVIALAANISGHVLTLGSAKDQALFDNYLSPMQVRISYKERSWYIIIDGHESERSRLRLLNLSHWDHPV